MDPIPLDECQKQLQSLSYSPILGNRHSSRTSDSLIPKLSFSKSRSKSVSASSVAKALSPGQKTPRKRLYSETNMSPKGKSPKVSKDDGDIKDMFAQLVKTNSEMAKNLQDLNVKFDSTEERLGDKIESNFTQLTSQISELRDNHDKEVRAREVFENNVNNKIEETNIRVEKTVEAFAETIDEKIEKAVARHMRSKDNQINATYYQSLVNDLKHHEKDLMIYGYKPDGGPDLAAEIGQKLFKDKINLEISNLKAVQVGSETGGKLRAIRVSLPSNEIRDLVCKQSSKLPRGVNLEKCLPMRYRQPNREFRKYSWQLKEAANVYTRVVFKGHKLVLEMKEPNEGDIRYDWTIVKEYFPQPESPTDRTQAQRDRLGLKPSKTIEQLNTNKVILSNLKVTGSNEETKEYFKKEFIADSDKDKVIEVDADKATSKNILVVTLASKQDCSYFKSTYEKKEFNGGENPRISVMFEKD